jgi:uncharacterized protein
MRASRYNLFLPLADGSQLAFNAVTAALAEVDPASYQRIQSILAGSYDKSDPQYQELLEQLTSAAFVIPEGHDELAWLKAQNRLRRFGNRILFLTIAPTMACNFACDYCFESHSGMRMADSTVDALIAFADRHLKRAEGLAVTWFGGEPTLCLDIVEKVQTALSESAARYEVPTEPASIVTNGYLLDGAMARRLRDLGMRDVQVTLDGPEKIHDVRRPLRNGGGTFRRILDNLQESTEFLNVVVRANIDVANMHQAHEVIEALDKVGVLDRINIYFAQVVAQGDSCADMRGRCLSTPQFSRLQVELYRDLVGRGFYRIEYPSLAAGGHCGADSAYSFVIAPNGLLFKCWEELGLSDEDSVGSLLTDEVTPRQRMNLAQYCNWDPFEKSGCTACDILPICMGGCPHRAIAETDSDRGYCCSWKYNLRDMLLMRYTCYQRKEVTA